MFLTVSPAFGQTTSSEYRGSFRPGHNLTVATGLQQSRWSLNLESLEKPLTTERFNFLTFMAYTYHFQVIQWTGLTVGTSVQLILDRTSKSGFQPKTGLGLPSVLAGIVQNLGTDARLLLLGEFGAAWYPSFKWKVEQTQAEYLGAVPDLLSLSAQIDFGLQKRNVLSVIAGWRLAADYIVGDKPAVTAEAAGFPEFRHEGWYLGVGLTRQVTETLTGVQSQN
ncbi:MAG: hypothetical protein EBR09_07210 [Proteobacteria bacterium]|nr:hypothetical protein [Pseudomonadota bacterium]